MILSTWCLIRVLHQHAAAVAGLGRAQAAVEVPVRRASASSVVALDRAGRRRRWCCPATRRRRAQRQAQRLHRRPRALAPWSCCSPRRCRRRGRSTSSAATCCRRSARCSPSASGSRSSLTALLFALAHGLQNFPLFFDRFMFGLIAAWLVIRTGGLEAGIALHVLNNFLAFGLRPGLRRHLRDAQRHRGQLVEHPGRPSRSPLVYAALVLWWPGGWGSRPRTRPPSDGASGRPRPALATADVRPDGARAPSGVLVAPEPTCILVRASQGADPMGYGVIGSPTGSGPVSLGSSPSTPAIWSRD